MPADSSDVSQSQTQPTRRPQPSAARTAATAVTRAASLRRDENRPDPPRRRSGSLLSGVLKSAIEPMPGAGKIRESLALAYWRRVAGPQAAAATQSECVRDGVLFVRTKSSVWSHELMLYKARLLQGLNRLLGGNVIHDIVFRAQGVPPPEPEPEPESPTLEDLDLVILTPEERIELRARLEALISIPDDRVRHGIAVRLSHEAKLRHWRLERGWKVCRRCDALHKTDPPLCPICRLEKLSKS